MDFFLGWNIGSKVFYFKEITSYLEDYDLLLLSRSSSRIQNILNQFINLYKIDIRDYVNEFITKFKDKKIKKQSVKLSTLIDKKYEIKNNSSLREFMKTDIYKLFTKFILINNKTNKIYYTCNEQMEDIYSKWDIDYTIYILKPRYNNHLIYYYIEKFFTKKLICRINTPHLKYTDLENINRKEKVKIPINYYLKELKLIILKIKYEKAFQEKKYIHYHKIVNSLEKKYNFYDICNPEYSKYIHLRDKYCLFRNLRDKYLKNLNTCNIILAYEI